MYNAVNFNLTYANIENFTVGGVQLSVLVCPSDINTRPAVHQRQANGFSSNYRQRPGRGRELYLQYFSSYSGNQGTFWSNYYIGAKGGTQVQIAAEWGDHHRRYRHARRTSPTGPAIRSSTARRPTDTLPSSMQLINIATRPGRRGLYFDTMLTTAYPPNLPTQQRPGLTPTGFNYYYATDATSYHPGGLNFAFCDGSVQVHQEHDQLLDVHDGHADSYGDQIPDGTTFNASTIIWTVTSARFGTYQALSTRSNGEVLDASSY